MTQGLIGFLAQLSIEPWGLLDKNERMSVTLVRTPHAVVQPRSVALAVAMVFMQGCGWYSSVSFPSPSQKLRISVGRGYSLMARVEIELLSKNTKRLIWRSPGEASFILVDVCWSGDEKQAGVIISGTGFWTLAFSDEGREIPFDLVRPQMESAIRKRYKVPYGISDAIVWLDSAEAHNQFTSKHPEIR